MPRPTVWRVRVMRTQEAFVDVMAFSAAGAEAEAAKVPGVSHVFTKSALRADEPEALRVRGEGQQGTREGELEE